MRREAIRAVVVIGLIAIVYVYDARTGLVPDVSGLYLTPVVLAAYWFGLPAGLAATAAALAADFLLHPIGHRSDVAVHTVTHLMTYAFAVFVTARLKEQLTTIRFLSERRDYELDLARELNNVVSEHAEIAEDSPFDVAIRLEPARELSGDQVLARGKNGELFACIADITGKGVSAALFSALLRSQLDDALRASWEVDEVVQRVNAGLFAALPPEMFVTVLCCHLRAQSLTFVNAGHEPAYLVHTHGDSSERLLSADAPPLGVQPVVPVDVQEVTFGTDARLVCYSDGITDSRGFQGDRARLRDFILRNRATPVGDLADRILAEAAQGSTMQRDDMSVIVVGWKTG